MTWSALSAQVAPRLRGASRFGITQHAAPTRVVIDAWYDATPPRIAPFRIRIGRVRLVVEVRTFELPPREPDLEAAAAVVFSGVHPGAGIAVQTVPGTRLFGGICAILASPPDARPTHLLTCGHLFARGTPGTPVFVERSGASVEIGRLETNLLDATTDARDVASVALLAEGIKLAMAGGPGPKLTGISDSAFGVSARTYRPTRAAYSSLVNTTGPFDKQVKSPIRGTYQLTGLIGTARISDDGDSGTILATRNPDEAVGCCVAKDSMSLFESVDRAVRDLSPLTVWRKP